MQDKAPVPTGNRSCLYIVTGSFLDAATGARALGGTETYTMALLGLASKLEWRAVVLQRGAPERAFIGPEGVQVMTWQSRRRLREMLRHLRCTQPGVAVSFEDLFVPGRADLPIVLIDHGVGGDGTFDDPKRPGVVRMLADARRIARRLRTEVNARRRLSRYSRVVCVDTNAINILRNAMPMFDWSRQLVYVPNFATLTTTDKVRKKWEQRHEHFVVLFARRFQFHRGVELWLRCLERLATEFPDVRFRVMGFGQPWEDSFQALTGRFPNVVVGRRTPEAMTDEYLDAHVSVVPSLWSEGTSLSAIESMAAGCCLVASNIGGLCNLVLPGFNGLLVPPLDVAVHAAVRDLLLDRDRAMQHGLNGFSVARSSFSRESWEARMAEVLGQALVLPAGAGIPRRERPEALSRR